jgi:hypothetical protein
MTLYLAWPVHDKGRSGHLCSSCIKYNWPLHLDTKRSERLQTREYVSNAKCGIEKKKKNLCKILFENMWGNCIPRHLPVGPEKGHDKPQCGQRVSEPRFKAGTSLTRRCVVWSTAMFSARTARSCTSSTTAVPYIVPTSTAHSCHWTSRGVQAFHAIKLPCSETR